jgi:glycosyltransferase involved in cell wall biosynthesis
MSVSLFGTLQGTTGPSRVTRGFRRGLKHHGVETELFYIGSEEADDATNVGIPGSLGGVLSAQRSARRQASGEVFHALQPFVFPCDVLTVQWTSEQLIRWKYAREEFSVRALAGDLLLNAGAAVSARRTPHVVATSPESARLTSRHWFTQPDATVPLGVPAEWLAEPGGSSRNVLLPGRINQKKGQAAFLEAFGDGRDLTLRVVGKRDDEADWKAQWNQWYRGVVSDDELERSYEWADVVVVPSRHECFSLVALEAMAKGCAVVITERCGIAQFDWATPENGLFTGSDPQSLVPILDDLIADPETLGEAKQAAYRRARELTWRKVTRPYVEIYRTIQENPNAKLTAEDHEL